jgi:C_GCAxxG_C_C family probable redox protein
MAAHFFDQGYSCSQAVLAAFAGVFELPIDQALRLAAPFGGGISHTGQMCGAVSGALMALGLRYGATSGDDKVTKERMYRIAQAFQQQFTTRFGSVTCPGLLGVDISTPAGLAQARQQNIFKSICPGLVRAAAVMAAELMVNTGGI